MCIYYVKIVSIKGNIMSTLTMRKNFTMSHSIVEKLEFLAQVMHKKQSQVIQELISEKMNEYEKVKKLQALEKVSGMFTGKLSEDTSIQTIKANSEN